MDTINTTSLPTPHLSLQDAVELLQAYGWTAGQITAITAQTELDWIESRERCYRLADATDARAARLAAQATSIGSSSTATRIAPPPKAKRVKKVAPGTGTLSITF